MKYTEAELNAAAKVVTDNRDLLAMIADRHSAGSVGMLLGNALARLLDDPGFSHGSSGLAQALRKYAESDS